MEGVIPYWTIPGLPLGPVTLQPFGMLVAIGVLFGAWVGRKRGEQLGVDEDSVRILTGYLLVFGFACAHWFDVFMYQPDKLGEDPLLLLKFWAGISSYGGFVGAFIGWWVFCWRHRVQSKWAIADITIWGTVPGFTIGRMGCSTVHDHFGRPAGDFFLAVDSGTPLKAGICAETNLCGYHGGYGPPLHDLGFYELLFLIGLILVLLALSRIRKPVGFIVAFMATAYGPVRFLFEPFRMSDTDPRYSILGLTPSWTFAQYVSVITIAAGIYAFYRIFRDPLWVDPKGGIENLDGPVLLGPPPTAKAKAKAEAAAAKAKVRAKGKAKPEPEPDSAPPKAKAKVKKSGQGPQKKKGKKRKR